MLLFVCDCLFVGGFPGVRLQQSFIKYIFNVHHVQDDEQTHSDEAKNAAASLHRTGVKREKGRIDNEGKVRALSQD